MLCSRSSLSHGGKSTDYYEALLLDSPKGVVSTFPESNAPFHPSRTFKSRLKTHLFKQALLTLNSVNFRMYLQMNYVLD